MEGDLHLVKTDGKIKNMSSSGRFPLKPTGANNNNEKHIIKQMEGDDEVIHPWHMKTTNHTNMFGSC